MPPRPSDKMLLVASSFLAQAMRIGAMLVMARLLTPHDYGLYALVLALPGVITSMNDLGISRAMVQMRDRPQEQVLHTALVLNVRIYALYAVLFAVGGVLLAMHHGDMRMCDIGLMVGVTTFLAGMYQFQLTCLWRERSFAIEARQNLIFAVASLATGVTLAATGWGVYALALQALTAQLVANLFILRVAPLPKPVAYDRAAARAFFRFGWATTSATYLSNVRGNILSLFITRLSGAPMLGQWGRAVQVQQLFGQNLMVPLERVVYPTLCANLDNRQRTGELIQRALAVHLMVSLLAAAWLLVNADNAIALVLGPQWLGIAPCLRILALAIPAGAVMSIAYSLWHAAGQTGYWLRLIAVDFALTMAALAGAAWWWHTGGRVEPLIAVMPDPNIVNPGHYPLIHVIAVIWAASQCGLALAAIGRGLRAYPPNWPALGRTLAILLLAAVAADAVMHLVNVWTPEALPIIEHWPRGLAGFVRIILNTAPGLAVYLAVLWLADRATLRDAWQLATRRGGTGA